MTRYPLLILAALAPTTVAIQGCVDTPDTVVERRVITNSSRPAVIRDRRPNAIVYEDSRPRSITYEDDRPESISSEDGRPDEIVYPGD